MEWQIGQAEAGRVLGREEGLEDALAVRGRDAGPAIRDFRADGALRGLRAHAHLAPAGLGLARRSTMRFKRHLSQHDRVPLDGQRCLRQRDLEAHARELGP